MDRPTVEQIASKHTIIHLTQLMKYKPSRNADLPARYRDDFYIKENFQPNLTNSRLKELNGLIEKGVFEIVKSEGVISGVRIFNNRFVDQI
ncbi:hypothetical protein Golomagni_02449 [Golovinomyces magnicellulatus]|nr:hypothetical protein Golomagni_02449 [Golovinomyces magnicellulatus]